MKKMMNEIIGGFFGVRISPLFNCEGFIEEGRLDEKDFLDLYSKYLQRAVKYINKNEIHLDGIRFEKYYTEPDYEKNLFEPINLGGLREVEKQRIFEVKRDSARVYKTNRYSRIMIRDFSPDLKEEEDLFLKTIFPYKTSEKGLMEDFCGLREYVYLVVFRFGDFNLPFLLHDFGFDEFSIIRLKLQELFGIDHF